MGKLVIGCANCKQGRRAESALLQVGQATQDLRGQLELMGIPYSFQLDEDPETKRSHYASSAPGECGESCQLQDPIKQVAVRELLAGFVEVE